MFKNNEAEETKKSAETIIGSALKVKGNFQGKGNIIVEGEVVGSLKTDNYVLIGDKAKITANIEAQTSRISGVVEGSVTIDGHLEITASAKINGDIQCSSLSVEKGALLNGKCSMGQPGKKEVKQKENQGQG